MDYSVKPAYTVTDPSGTASFANGQDALVTFAGQGATPNQIYLISNETKQLIPFSSMQSAINYFSNITGRSVTPDEINSNLTQIPSSSLSPGSSLAGFVPVSSTNGFDENGHMTNPAPSEANIAARYGQDVNQNSELKAYTALDGFVKLLGSGAAGQSSVTQSELTNLTSNPTTMGFYINALAYGGYTLQDVYQEMIRQQAIDTGNGSQVMNSYPISTSQNASTYKAGLNYQSVKNNPTLNVSPTIAGIDPSILNNPVLQLPDAAFKAIAPLSDPNSPQFQQQMQNYTQATYGVALEMASAQSESDHAKAQNDWQTLQSEIQDRLGITLSDNAIQAWNQLSNLNAQSGAANLGGSGIVQQQVDDYLRQQGTVNQAMRQYYNTYEDQSKESYYQNYASPDEVKALIASDPQRAQAWGLVPSDAAKQYLTMDNLQQLFPNEPAANLQAIINQYTDPNGNFYSTIYKNYAAQKYNTTGQQQVAEANAVTGMAQNAATNALAQYSDPNNPFLKPGSNPFSQPQLPSSQNGTNTPTATGAIAALNKTQTNAAQNLSTPTPTPNAAPSSTPSTPTPNNAPQAPAKPQPTPATFSNLSPLTAAGPQKTSLGSLGNLNIGSSGQLSSGSQSPSGSAPAWNPSTGSFTMNTTAPKPQASSPLITGSSSSPSWLQALGSGISSVGSKLGSFFGF